MLTAASLAPLFVFAAAAVMLLVANERSTIERQSVGRARSAMSAVDAEINGSVTSLLALAVSAHLDTGDLPAFNAEARRVLATQPAWLNIGLASPAKEQLMDALLPPGAIAPFGADEEAFDIAVRTGQPTVGGVLIGIAVEPAGGPGPSAGNSGRCGALRAIGAGQTRDLRGSAARATPSRELGRRAGRRQGKSDCAHPRAARRTHHHFRVLQVRRVSHADGWYHGFTLEGGDTYTAYVTSLVSGWLLGIAIPADVVEAGAWRTLWIMTVGMLAALGVAIGFAWFIAREIERPVAALASAADAMGRGVDVPIQRTGRIAELDRLSEAFREASAAVRQREVEPRSGKRRRSSAKASPSRLRTAPRTSSSRC